MLARHARKRGEVAAADAQEPQRRKRGRPPKAQADATSPDELEPADSEPKNGH
jgi:hypothetical protein